MRSPDPPPRAHLFFSPPSWRSQWDDHHGLAFDKDMTTLDTCNEMTHAVNDPANYMAIDHAVEVIFTYDIIWEESDTHWANRWDVYLRGNPDDKIHWCAATRSKRGAPHASRNCPSFLPRLI